MKFDPDIHRRRSVRLPCYDYSSAGAYFVTVCAQNMQCIFGEAKGGRVDLNAYGVAAQRCWEGLEEHFENVSLDEYVIMPNHLHGIIVLAESAGAASADSSAPEKKGEACLAPTVAKPAGRKHGSLGAIVGAFKSAVSREVNLLRNSPGASVWQRSYHEHVIRNAEDLEKIREYIFYNPAKWAEDEYNRP